MGYAEDISIDKHNMEEECARQPMLFFEYAEKHAGALQKRRVAEIELETVQSEAYDRARVVAGDAKVTETAVKRLMALDDDFIGAQKDLTDVAYDVNMLAAAIDALNTKTRMLETMTKMQLAHWQSEPRGAPGTSAKQVVTENKERETTQKQKEGLQSMGKKPQAGLKKMAKMK